MEDMFVSAVAALTLILYGVFLISEDISLQENVLAVILGIIILTSVYFIWDLRAEMIEEVES